MLLFKKHILITYRTKIVDFIAYLIITMSYSYNTNISKKDKDIISIFKGKDAIVGAFASKIITKDGEKCLLTLRFKVDDVREIYEIDDVLLKCERLSESPDFGKSSIFDDKKE